MSGGARIRTSHSVAVIVVTLLTVAAGWAVAWRSFTELRQERIALAISEGGKVLLSFEDHAANLFDAGDTRLRSLRSVLGNLGTGERLRQHLADIRLPGDETLSRSTVITDRAGAIVFESSFATPPAASLADRPYVRHLKETVRDELVIDSTSLGILSGKPRFRLVRPILADGRFDGVIAQVLEPDHLAGFYRSFDLGPDSVLFVLNVTDHRYLARLPVGDNRLYDGPLAGARIWEHLAEHPSGTFTNTSPVDGIPRYYLYRRLTDYPVVIALGIAEHTILDSLAGARNNLILQSGLFSAAVRARPAPQSRGFGVVNGGGGTHPQKHGAQPPTCEPASQTPGRGPQTCVPASPTCAAQPRTCVPASRTCARKQPTCVQLRGSPQPPPQPPPPQQPREQPPPRAPS